MIDRELYELLEPGVAAMGFELVTVELTGRGKSSLLRVYIDSPLGVSVDDCARVSDQVSAILDVRDPIPDHYTLEVSSPGFDRPLRTPEHFEAVVGQRVKLRTSSPVDGRRGFTGVLRAANEVTVTVEVDGKPYRLAMDTIAKARLVPDYGSEAGVSRNPDKRHLA